MVNIDFQSIKEKVDEILIEFDMYKKVPVDVLKICKIKDIDVKIVKFKDESICAAIHKSKDAQGESKYTIYIKYTQSPLEQRVSIAHELGHYYLHKEILEKEMLVDMYKKFSSKEEKEEVEADYFSRCILLEEDAVTTLFNEIGNVNDLANVFKVPVEFIEKRLKELNLCNG